MQCIREMIKYLEDNISRVSNLEDLRIVEENISHYKRRMDELDADVKTKDSRLNEGINHNFSQRMDVDVNRIARSDFEAENKNLSDVKIN